MFPDLQERCDSTTVFSAGAVLLYDCSAAAFSGHKANDDNPNTATHDFIAVKISTIVHAFTKDSPSADATIFTQPAGHELSRAISYGNPAGEIFDGS